MPKKPQDATLRNVRAAKSRDQLQRSALDARITTLGARLTIRMNRLEQRLVRLERPAKKGGR